MIPGARRNPYNGHMHGLTPEETQTLVELLTRHRWVALATVNQGEPLASQVAVVPDSEPVCYLMHLSELAPHTRNLLADQRASLLFAQSDLEPGADPQTLARVSLQGAVSELTRDHTGYPAARERYLAALPHAEVQFGLGDFRLLRFVASHARLICGFGRAHRLDGNTLNEYLSTSG